jgi:hypothetical protein
MLSKKKSWFGWQNRWYKMDPTSLNMEIYSMSSGQGQTGSSQTVFLTRIGTVFFDNLSSQTVQLSAKPSEFPTLTLQGVKVKSESSKKERMQCTLRGNPEVINWWSETLTLAQTVRNMRTTASMNPTYAART